MDEPSPAVNQPRTSIEDLPLSTNVSNIHEHSKELDEELKSPAVFFFAEPKEALVSQR